MTMHAANGLRRALLAWAVAALVGCSGSGSGDGNGSGVGAPPTGAGGSAAVLTQTGPVEVTVVDASGRPLADAEVLLSSSGGSSTAYSDTGGRVTFSGIPAGNGNLSVSTRRDGYFSQTVANLSVRDQTTTALTIRLESLARATPVLLGARGKPSADGSRLRVEVDLAVLDERGEVIESLAASDFALGGEPCGWGRPCLYTPAGDHLPGEIYYDTAITATLLQRGSAGNDVAASRTALLLEESAAMASRDPQGVRYAAVDRLLAASFAPDLVALGSYRADGDRPLLTVHGEFTSDGASLRPALETLRGHASGPNPVLSAVSAMLDFVNSPPPAATHAARTNLVTFISDGRIADSEGDWPRYGGRLGRLAAAARTGDVRLVVIGSGNASSNGNGLTALAMLTGGLHVAAAHPWQLAAISPRLPDLLARRVGFQRLRFELQGSRPRVFTTGTVADVLMTVQAGAGLTCHIDLPIPIH